jgi:ABC-type ATPase with predicted acetyltransferase domain
MDDPVGVPRHVASLKVRRGPRRYDRERGCYVYDVSFTASPPLSERVRGVAEAFGVALDDRRQVLYRDFELRLGEGDVVYVTGDSGSGKSVLLRVLREDLGGEVVDIAEVAVEDERPIVETVGSALGEALNLLSRVGLNDAYLFMRGYGELSEGQRYRYRVARMLESGRRFWAAALALSSARDEAHRPMAQYS